MTSFAGKGQDAVALWFIEQGNTTMPSSLILYVVAKEWSLLALRNVQEC